MDKRVIDSRMVVDGDSVRRRRQSAQCMDLFTSYEVAELRFPKILKANDRCEAFNEEKLRTGIFRAIEKRPVTAEMAISRVKHQLYTHSDRAVCSSQLGDWVMLQLRSLDKVAYIRFASVHKNFAYVDKFLQEIQRVENDLPAHIKKNQLDLLDSNGEDN